MPRKPGSVAASTRKTAPAKRSSAASGATTGTRRSARQRRSPYEIVQELKERRAELERSFQTKVAKLDERIRQLEERHGERIKISQLLETKTPEELAKELEDIKRQHALLRKAMKKSGG